MGAKREQQPRQARPRQHYLHHRRATTIITAPPSSPPHRRRHQHSCHHRRHLHHHHRHHRHHHHHHNHHRNHHYAAFDRARSVVLAIFNLYEETADRDLGFFLSVCRFCCLSVVFFVVCFLRCPVSLWKHKIAPWAGDFLVFPERRPGAEGAIEKKRRRRFMCRRHIKHRRRRWAGAAGTMVTMFKSF